MRETQEFFVCRHCGNMIGLLHDGGVAMMCCGEKMHKIEPNTTEAASEKHLPVVSVSGDTVEVSVGENPHPMDREHSVEWIYLETERGGQRKRLRAGEKPTACFKLADDSAIAVFAYCNKHGMWKTEINK